MLKAKVVNAERKKDDGLDMLSNEAMQLYVQA